MKRTTKVIRTVRLISNVRSFFCFSFSFSNSDTIIRNFITKIIYYSLAVRVCMCISVGRLVIAPGHGFKAATTQHKTISPSLNLPPLSNSLIICALHSLIVPSPPSLSLSVYRPVSVSFCRANIQTSH